MASCMWPSPELHRKTVYFDFLYIFKINSFMKYSIILIFFVFPPKKESESRLLSLGSKASFSKIIRQPPKKKRKRCLL
jgi:hypothetical protein